MTNYATVFPLGWRVRDKISGLEGVCIARTEFLFGCVRIAIQPEREQNGQVPEPYWLDEPQCEALERTNLLPGTNEPLGGPRPDARRSSDAKR